MNNKPDGLLFHTAICAGATNSIYRRLKSAYAFFNRGAFAKYAPAWMIIMEIVIRKYEIKDLPEMIKIWNEVVAEGTAFPQEEFLTEQTAADFFGTQVYSAVACDTDTDRICGLYILHPNNIGRCGHICNASYAVSSGLRGLHIGEQLVLDSLLQGKINGFRLLQFNAVVADNTHARHLYERLGFTCLGTIPGGFRISGSCYKDICIYYHEL